MAIPDAQSIMLPLLELAGENHIHQVRDAVNRLDDRIRLTDEESSARRHGPDGVRRRATAAHEGGAGEGPSVRTTNSECSDH